MNVLICTITDDFHAVVVQHALNQRAGVRCDIVETDRLSDRQLLTWSNVPGYAPALCTADGAMVDVRDVDLIWWRRGNVSLEIPAHVDEAAHQLVTNDCQFALLGLLMTEFGGAWVSAPQATRRAQNKVVQLHVAQEVGFRTPRTLVSQDPDRVRAFCSSLGTAVVAKTVKGSPGAPTLTMPVDAAMLAADDALRVCPAIYQEYIPGSRHLRICCFGAAAHAAMIETDALDWRADLNVPVRPYVLDDATEDRLRHVLGALGLRMGIVDMKLDPAGEPVWFEVNPQGQFLFLEGLCGLPLLEAFTDFLLDEGR